MSEDLSKSILIAIPEKPGANECELNSNNQLNGPYNKAYSLDSDE